MTINKLTYIGLLLCVAVLAGCSDDITTPNTLSGDGTKTPLTVTALLDASGKAAKTRAVDKTFEENDKLLAYIRHVMWDGSTGDRTSVAADKAPRLVTFTKGSTTMTAYSGEDISPIGLAGKENEYDRHLHLDNTNTQQTKDLTNDLGVGGGHIYWDDFSETAADKNLHTANHYLQSYYGYCYNGSPAFGETGTYIKTALVEGTGELGWSVATDQSAANTTDPKAFQHSDLLWSAEQTPVRYEHKATIGDETRNGIVLPYTHAMSKVTINVIAGEGFASDYDFASTGAKLDMVRTTCTAIAPTATLDFTTSPSVKADVTMKKGALGTTDSKPSHTFQAIIVPSVLTVGNKFASITGMDGNEYFVYVTDNIINGWSSQLTDTDEDIHNGTAQVKPQTRANEAEIPGGAGHQMKSGVHYILNVTVNKTEVTVSAMILDWNEVEVEGEGIIHFSNDVADKGTIADSLKLHGFDIYKSPTTTFGTKATTVRWNKANNEWRYNPAIYWQGGTPEYFRALWNARTDTPGTADVNESLHMENGRDVLWGTTKAHSGTDADGQAYNYAEGAALKPRTGDVPLQFYHAMSKITFHLEDAAKGSSNDDSKLDLSRATIQLTNLATGGTIVLNDGSITTDAITPGQKTFSEDNGAVPKRMGYYAAKENGVETSYNPSLTIKDYYIIPQELTDDVMLTITLANGTTYKAKLNTCRSQNGVDGSGNPVYDYVTEWLRGKSYIYTITLAKDTIEFCAEIKEWDEVKASGTITPEW